MLVPRYRVTKHFQVYTKAPTQAKDINNVDWPIFNGLGTCQFVERARLCTIRLHYIALTSHISISFLLGN